MDLEIFKRGRDQGGGGLSDKPRRMQAGEGGHSFFWGEGHGSAAHGSPGLPNPDLRT
jgi:hypothetical protein